MSLFADRVRFLQMFVTAPRIVGAIAPSSSGLAEKIVRHAGVAEARRIVELGGGTGSFTQRIVRDAPATSSILSVEINPTFADLLASRFQRVRVIADSAEHVRHHMEAAGMVSADCVISGLPWAAFDGDLQLRLLVAIRSILEIGGTFTTFAYLHAAWMPAARRFRDLLHSFFDTVHQTSVVWRNLPPAFVYRCQRTPSLPQKNHMTPAEPLALDAAS